ncbi:hypothetical protein SCA6_011730 [Theobroma cacao]
MNLDGSVKIIDKSWMCCSRLSKGYIDGVRQFLDFAFENGSKGGLILCPCKTCNNCLWKDQDEVYNHFICKGTDQGYIHWIYHGKRSSPSMNVHDDVGMGDESNMHDDVEQLVQDVMKQEGYDDHMGFFYIFLFSTKKTSRPTKALRIRGLTENNPFNNLTTFLRTLARNAMLALLVYVDWRTMPQSNKNDMWDLVKAKFGIEARAKKWVLSTIATDWRNYKYDVRLKNCLEGVPFEHWKVLVAFCSSKERKKVNRGNIEETSQADMFLLTHEHKNGELDEESMRILNSKDLEAQNEIFAHVMGHDKTGHVSLYRRSVIASNLKKKPPSFDSMDA